MELPIGVTTMDVAWNGGSCSECMGYYGTTVTLNTTWTRVEVKFDELKQAGFGVPQVALRRDLLVGFILWPRHPTNLWIDDLKFLP